MKISAKYNWCATWFIEAIMSTTREFVVERSVEVCAQIQTDVRKLKIVRLIRPLRLPIWVGRWPKTCKAS